MKAALLLALGLAACDPFFGASVTLRDPAHRPIDNATVAIACSDGHAYPASGLAVRTKHDGTGRVGSIGGMWPVGCDLFIAKPGFRTHQVRYRELCPDGPDGCKRYFEFDLVLEPE